MMESYPKGPYQHVFCTKPTGKSHDELMMLCFPGIQMSQDKSRELLSKVIDGFLGLDFLFLKKIRGGGSVSIPDFFSPPSTYL
jgi:hypothetical protein